MSSDEEIPSTNQEANPDGAAAAKLYRRSRKWWLAQWVVDVHARVDARAMKYSQETFVRGSLPHLRVLDDSAPLSLNPMVVQGLAENVYDGEYLAWLKPEDRENLCVDRGERWPEA